MENGMAARAHESWRAMYDALNEADKAATELAYAIGEADDGTAESMERCKALSRLAGEVVSYLAPAGGTAVRICNEAKEAGIFD